MIEQIFTVFLVIWIPTTQCSFWNEIPPKCIYDQTTLFSCWNTRFTQPIPLFNNLQYTLQNHHVQIRDSYFGISLNDLFSNVGYNIERLSLTNNTFSLESFNQSEKIYFRALQSLKVQDLQGIQWFQLNASYFPQLVELDLSFNNFTNAKNLIFNQQYFPALKYLNLSYNQLKSIDNLNGTSLRRIENLILAFNPLKTIINTINRFQSLRFLDLSGTLIKDLFSVTLLPRLETFSCRYCQQIAKTEYNKFLSNCSQLNNQLMIDLADTSIDSLQLFNPYIKCIQYLTLNYQDSIDSISTDDLLLSVNLQTIEIRGINIINSINLNVYDRLKSIDFSNNIKLTSVSLRLLSDYSYLQRLILSGTALEKFSIDFNNTVQTFLHIDIIDMSYSRLETVDFLKYLTFYTLDVSYNRLKIIDINQINFRRGMYELLMMNSLNLSSNNIESIKINWNNESPHTIDLSQNNLQSIELHGQTTYTLLLNKNLNLSMTSSTFNLDLPALIYLDLNSIYFDSFENLIYLYNLSNIHTLILSNNLLNKQQRTLNWYLFYPWHQTLTHLLLQNMSLEKVDSGTYLNDYMHLLTVDFYSNENIECGCTLKPFIDWLKVPPPPLADFYEPRRKILSTSCPAEILQIDCNTTNTKGKTKLKFILAMLIVGACLSIILIVLKFLRRYIKQKRPKPYNTMCPEIDSIALTEDYLTGKDDHQ